MFKSYSPLFFRRLKLYGFGLGLGMVLSYGFFHDRYPTWLPGSIIMEELNQFQITYAEKAVCFMKCRNISKDGIQEVLANGGVIFSESEPRAEPCPSYVIEGETKAGRALKIVFVKCDSTDQVLSAVDLNESYDCLCE